MQDICNLFHGLWVETGHRRYYRNRCRFLFGADVDVDDAGDTPWNDNNRNTYGIAMLHECVCGRCIAFSAAGVELVGETMETSHNTVRTGDSLAGGRGGFISSFSSGRKKKEGKKKTQVICLLPPKMSYTATDLDLLKRLVGNTTPLPPLRGATKWTWDTAGGKLTPAQQRAWKQLLTNIPIAATERLRASEVMGTEEEAWKGTMFEKKLPSTFLNRLGSDVKCSPSAKRWFDQFIAELVEKNRHGRLTKADLDAVMVAAKYGPHPPKVYKSPRQCVKGHTCQNGESEEEFLHSLATRQGGKVRGTKGDLPGVLNLFAQEACSNSGAFPDEVRLFARYPYFQDAKAYDNLNRFIASKGTKLAGVENESKYSSGEEEPEKEVKSKTATKRNPFSDMDIDDAIAAFIGNPSKIALEQLLRQFPEEMDAIAPLFQFIS
jgi:hypothetical protein